MAASNAAFTTGTEQTSDLRRRNVPTDGKSNGALPSGPEASDEKKRQQKVRGLFAIENLLPILH